MRASSVSGNSAPARGRTTRRHGYLCPSPRGQHEGIGTLLSASQPLLPQPEAPCGFAATATSHLLRRRPVGRARWGNIHGWCQVARGQRVGGGDAASPGSGSGQRCMDSRSDGPITRGCCVFGQRSEARRICRRASGPAWSLRALRRRADTDPCVAPGDPNDAHSRSPESRACSFLASKPVIAMSVPRMFLLLSIVSR